MRKNDIEDRWGTHLVRITLMYGQTVGHVTVQTNGNIKGLDVINTAIDNLQSMEGIVRNDCNFQYDEKTDAYIIQLRMRSVEPTPAKTFTTILEWRDIEDMIVCVEIVDFQPQNERV